MNSKKVDADDDDEILDEVDENQNTSGLSSSQWAALLDARASEVRGYLNRGDVARAVITVLTDAPAGAEEYLRDKNLKIVMDAVQAVKSADIQNIVKELSPAQLDLLMKLTYKGMAFPEQFNSANLLIWHEKILEIGGIGTIVRALTDKKTV